MLVMEMGEKWKWPVYLSLIAEDCHRGSRGRSDAQAK